MTVSLKFYADPGLNTELLSLPRSANADGSSGAVDSVIYVGSTAAGKTYRADSNPGVDPILLTPTDANGATGQTVAALKLALSAAGLAGAAPGAALNLGTQILSGTGGAVAVYLRWTNAVSVTGAYTDLSLAMTSVRET